MSTFSARSCSIFTFLVLSLFSFATVAVAQNVDRQGQFTTSDHATSPPLRNVVPLQEQEGHRDKPIRMLTAGTKSASPDRALQTAPAAVTAIGTLVSFDGLGVGGGYTPNAAPPDTNGAVGATQFVQWVNESFAVYDKTSGARLYGPAAGNTLFQALGASHPCAVHNDGDPIAQYDKAAGRWVMTQFSVTNGGSQGYWQCVAVSKTSDATGAYNLYAFNYGTVQFNDYPKLGVWPNAYNVTFNIFNNGSTFAGSKLCAYDRNAMIAGTAANQVCFQTSSAYGGLLPADLDGATPPPAGSPGYFIAFDVNSLLLWKMSNVNFVTSTATLTGPITIPVAAFAAACSGGGTCIPQTGTSQQLDSLADRLMYRLAYRNFGDHEAIVVNHSVTAGSSVGVRWYELRKPNGTPTIFQQGTYAPDTNYRWMGSAAMDRVGNIAVGYSVSSSSLFPAIRFAGRGTADPLGTLGTEVFMKDGLGSQNGGLNRWGDYSSLSVDPVDDCTMWYTTEYLQTTGSFNWSTRIGYFKFTNCSSTPDFSLSATPASQTVTQGAGTTYTATVNPSGGFNGTVTFSASGLPSGAAASFNPASVTTSGSSTMTVTTAGNTPTGTYPLTITGTSGALSHTASVSLVVQPAPTPDFSLSTTPSSVTVTAGSTANYTENVTRTGGFTGSVSLSISGLPAGAAGTFTPNPNTGASSALAITTSTSTPAGSYVFTVTGTSTSPALTRTSTATLVVQTPDFSLATTPSSVTVTAGSTASYTESVTRIGGFTGSVSLSISGLPAGAAGTFSPNPNTAASSALSITTSSTTPVGSYVFTVTGTSTSPALTRTSTATLVVQAPATGNFTLAISPTSRSVNPGQGTTYAITITRTSFTSAVTLSVSGLGTGATGTFSPNNTTGNTSTLTVTTTTAATPGTRAFTVTGTGGGLTRTVGGSLVVNNCVNGNGDCN